MCKVRSLLCSQHSSREVQQNMVRVKTEVVQKVTLETRIHIYMADPAAI